MTRANHDMRPAHLFLHLPFKESKKSNCIHFLYFNLQSSSFFAIIT
jgi:hypothetical protein